jgi:hypothetical protein
METHGQGHGCLGEQVKADKGQFDEALRRMLAKSPQKTTEIKAPKKEPAPRKSGKRK